MILSGKFRLLGIEEAPLNSEKHWMRAALSQGTAVNRFYIKEETIAKVLRSLPEAAEISATVQVNVTEKGTYLNLLSLNAED